MVRKGLPRLYFKKLAEFFRLRSVWNQNRNSAGRWWHKHNIFDMNLKKTEPAIIWKRVHCQRITSKNTRPWWVDTWARDTVRWYWSADTLLWQLSIDHNINVQYVCNISLAVLPNWLESVRLNIGFPVVRTDGLAVYGEVITKFSGMVRFTCPWCSEGALRSPEFRYEELHGIFHDDDNIKLQAVLSSRKGLVKRGK